MKILIYSTLLTVFGNISFAAANSRTHGDDPAVRLIQPSANSEQTLGDNMSSIMNLSNAKLMSNVIVLYNNLASKSLNKGSLKAAEETLLKKSIPLSIRYGNDRTNYNCFMALAKCYVDQKKYTQAKWYYIQSNISAKKAKYGQGEVLSLMQLARLKKVIGDDKLALDDFKEAEKLAVKINFKSQLPQIRKSIAAFPVQKTEKAEIASASKAEKGS